MTTRMELQERLNRIEQELADTRKRIPAHSIKPPIMMALFALEDEREQVLKQIALLETHSDRQ